MEEARRSALARLNQRSRGVATVARAADNTISGGSNKGSISSLLVSGSAIVTHSGDEHDGLVGRPCPGAPRVPSPPRGVLKRGRGERGASCRSEKRVYIATHVVPHTRATARGLGKLRCPNAEQLWWTKEDTHRAMQMACTELRCPP